MFGRTTIVHVAGDGMRTMKTIGVRVAARKMNRAVGGADRVMKKKTTAALGGGMKTTTTTVRDVVATRRTMIEIAVAADRIRRPSRGSSIAPAWGAC